MYRYMIVFDGKCYNYDNYKDIYNEWKEYFECCEYSDNFNIMFFTKRLYTNMYCCRETNFIDLMCNIRDVRL